ncbi:uncharacterized protein MKK02DRAFT_45068 [Dioszegia hungarica]|uniref:Uncharacterized protein n=1 Tax=Dioszegia hungarica TaxID=4972 RepID=A0AA38LWA2_9TREE|nr:uncharacterized protein MKK02DRAFT_45068 [Dioszegia hungarica]KAI9636361.1 hypothetical protein MKK02DRAFT_45068 [Dioszegia hungarica]
MILRHPLLLLIAGLISSFLVLPILAHNPLPPPLPPNAPILDARATGDLICRPFGSCEPCPPDELDQPFCMPYGNRRLLHCRKPGQSTGGSGAGGGAGAGTGAGKDGAGEIPAWEACGKVVKKERQDFWEFVVSPSLN